MSLAPGTRLGPYEILSPLGAGGMGEVYRARDSRLGRSVAIKVLPTSFAQDAERLRRFEQEAQAAGGLNHPNITAVYELGAHEGAPYIVTELLEGETLRARLSGGALPIRKATDYAIQMAKGLAAAHEKGIVHRDLKPDNLFVTNDGRIKILDFGLAKLTQRDDGAGGQTNLPTVTGTEPGVVLGTLGYMAPEQVKGKPADARSDIFAFGAILYEMLSGSRAFHRDSAAETMSAILREEPPDLSATNKSVQPGLERIIRHCLEKNPEERFHSAHDLAFDLEALSGISGTAVAAAPSRVSRVRPLPLVAAVLALAALAAAAWLGLSRGRSAPAASPRVLRTNVLLPENLTLNNAVISPDGSRIVFGGTDASGNVQLWVRPLDSYTSTPLAGTDGGVLPFWSPDARFIGFFADKKMKRIEASGGAPIVLAEVDGLGGAWAPNGDIFFTGPSGPIQRLPAAGGKPEPVTKLDASRGETAHRYPYFLPDGRHFLYLAINLAGPRNDPANRIWVGSVDGAPSKPLIPSNFNAQYSDGYLLFIRGGDFGGSLLAQPFDVDRLETSGQPITVAEQVGLYGDFLALGNYTVSGARTLVYDASQLSTRLEWLDRNGKQMGTFGEPAAHFGLRLSPDGSRVAVGVYDPRSQTTQLWVGDVARGVRTRLTSGPGSNSNPVWSPDGSRIAFQTDRKHQADMYVMPAAGSGAEEAITDEEGQRLPQDWSKDGRYIVYVDREAAGSRLQQVLVMPMTGERKPLTLLPRSANDFGFSMRFSPDGRWVTYDVDESGRREVYVVSFPEGQSKVQISSSGGQNPKWGRGGKEIVYSSFDGKVLSVDVDGSRGLRVGTPRPLFQLPERTFGWDVTADGERFLINVPVIKSSSIPLSVVVNWSAGLKN